MIRVADWPQAGIGYTAAKEGTRHDVVADWPQAGIGYTALTFEPLKALLRIGRRLGLVTLIADRGAGQTQLRIGRRLGLVTLTRRAAAYTAELRIGRRLGLVTLIA